MGTTRACGWGTWLRQVTRPENSKDEIRTPCLRQGWGLRPQCFRGHCLGQGEIRTGHPASTRRTVMRVEGNLEVAGGGLELGRAEVWHKTRPRRPVPPDIITSWRSVTALRALGNDPCAIVSGALNPHSSDDMYLCIFRQ